MRTAIGVRRASGASTDTQRGARRRSPTAVATSPPRRYSVSLPPFAPHPPDDTMRTRPITRRTTPGSAERCTAFGGAGRPERAATTEIWVTERAGRRAARVAVTIARAIAVAINHHGRSVHATRWWALVAR